MTKIEVIGHVANFFSGVQKFFGNYQRRVKDGLIDTGDALVYWTGKPKKRNGDPYSPIYIGKKIAHYRRQWFANRKKLK